MCDFENLTPDQWDERFLRRSFEVARRSTSHGNHPFGAILVDRHRKILIETENGYMPARDGTAHAERLLATEACRSLSPDVLAEAARVQGKTLSANGRSGGTPRSVAFNVQGFRIAVNKGTGEIKILKSVHAADAGRVANPMQCRGQVEGGVAQSLGATLYEEMVIDGGGRVINPKIRDYHLPSFADIPRTEVFFADTVDSIGPMGAKSMSESPYNPVAAALGNALADATGIRFTAVPLKPDRLFPALHEKFGKT